MKICCVLMLEAVRLVAILPWFTFLFTIVASVTLFVAASRVKQLEESGEPDLMSKASEANPDVV
jgi:hypothetical protein